MRRISRHSTRTVAAAGLAIAALTLSSCSDSEEDTSASNTEATSTEASAAASATTDKEADSGKDSEQIATIENAYIKSKGADKSMTAVFGDLKNMTDEELHLVGFSTSIPETDGKAPKYEIHKTVDGKMMENKDGITLEPKGEHILQPGGDHLMIMETPVDMPVGSEFDVTLKFENGKTVTLKNVPVRYQPAGEEDYVSGDDSDHAEMDHGSMDHGSMDHGDHADMNHDGEHEMTMKKGGE